MTKEDIDKLRELAEGMLKALEDIKPEEELEKIDVNSTQVVLRKYLDAFAGGNFAFFFDPEECKITQKMHWYHPLSANPFCNYLSEDYARFGTWAKKFLDACLAFKWCWDPDYFPNWDNTDESKWFVAWDTKHNEFYIDCCCRYHNISTVYFSTQDVATKCARWLDTIFVGGNQYVQEG